MKKVLLAGTALVGLVALAAPAHAELKTEVGGFFRGYGIYTNNDEVATTSTSDSLRNVELRRENELHFNGETTLDNGLTVGAHTELSIGGPVDTDETYAYFSGGWGRVNFGTEDGAAYLLQVAAPSADSNVDGLRPVISGVNPGVWVGGSALGAPNRPALLQNLTTYQVADFSSVVAKGAGGTAGAADGQGAATDRITYLTPKFNGFQAGVSWAPRAISYTGLYSGLTATGADDMGAGAYDQLWEAAARWDGEFQGFGISVGGGYSSASSQTKGAAGTLGSDDLQTWDAAANVTWSGFSLGGGYKWTNNGINAVAGQSSDTNVWFAGLGWDNGPWHAGASYLNGDADGGAHLLSAAGNTEVTYNQYTLGGGYTFGPGMTFRGAYQWGKVENKLVAGTVTTNFQQATVGTDIQF